MAFDPRNLKHKISQARTHVILRDPFFATILMDMDPVIDGSRTETCATDGDSVMFNPEWLAQADTKLVGAAMRKMSLHVALSHHLRRGPHRKPAIWRRACDEAALHIMKNDGVELPHGSEPMSLFDGMTAEEIYRHLEEMQDDDNGQDPEGQPQGGAGGGGDGDGQGDQKDQPGADGGVGQALDGADMRDPADVSQKQADNDQRVVRAGMAAKAAGKESALANELVKQIKGKGVDWRDRLNAFIDDRAEIKFSWGKPNRRFVGEDIYLPGKTANGIDTLAFIVDTSGSMSNEVLRMCVGQIEAAREAIGIRRVVVIECDARVGRIDEFEMSDPLPEEMEFTHRGGTDMAPAFEAAKEFDASAIICLTDGYFFETLADDPGAPVLFAITHDGEKGDIDAVFGERLELPNPADL